MTIHLNSTGPRVMTPAAPPASSRGDGRPSRRRHGWTGLAFAAPAVAYTLLFFIVPLVLTLVMSGYDYPLLGDQHWRGSGNYSQAASDEIFRHSVVFTAKYTVLVTLLTVVLAFALAMLTLARSALAWVCRVAVFLPVVVGLPAASLLWLSLYNDQVGPIDALLVSLGVVRHPVEFLATPPSAFLSVVALTVWKTVGFGMMIYIVGLQAIPDDVREAARIDGASSWQTLRWLTIPLLRRTTGMVVFLTVTTSFLVFDQVYILTRGGPSNSTISVVYWIYSSAFVRFRLGYAASLSVVLLVVLLVASALQAVSFRENDE